MLEITECNIRLKMGVQKMHGLLIAIERAWASARGQNGHLFPLVEIGTKNQNFLANLK